MSNPSEFNAGKMFIGGLSINTTQDTLRSHFEKYGEVFDSVLMVDRTTGRSRGFGFITMKDPEVINKILIEMPQVLDGKEIDCKKAVPKDNGPSMSDAVRTNSTESNDLAKTKKIFVGGLPHNLTEKEFHDHFEKYGPIKDCVVMLDRATGKPRGFGFITFENEDDVEKVMKSYKDHMIGGKWVDCKRATPKMQEGMTSSSPQQQQNTSSSQLGANMIGLQPQPNINGFPVMYNQMHKPETLPLNNQVYYNKPPFQEYYQQTPTGLTDYYRNSANMPQQMINQQASPFSYPPQTMLQNGMSPMNNFYNYSNMTPNSYHMMQQNKINTPTTQTSFIQNYFHQQQAKQKINNIIDLMNSTAQQQRHSIGGINESSVGLLESFDRLAIDSMLAKSNIPNELKPRSLSMTFDANTLTNKLNENNSTFAKRLSDADTFTQYTNYGPNYGMINPAMTKTPLQFQKPSLFKAASLSPGVNTIHQLMEEKDDSYGPQKVNNDKKNGVPSRADRSYKPY